MKKILLIALSVILCLSFVVGCSAPEAQGPTYYDATYAPETTTPIEKLTLTSNGATEYKIVIPKDAGEIVTYAGEELKLYFDKATGTNIQIVTDEGLTYSETEGKYLSVGNTVVKTATGVVADFAELDRDGFVIKTVNDDYVMCGGGDYGTLYSVYEFLHQAFGWETYAADEIYFEKVAVAEVAKLDFKDKPAFKNRTGGYFEGRTDAYFTAKLRTYADYGLGIFGEDLWGVWGHSNTGIMNCNRINLNVEGCLAQEYTTKSHPQFFGGEQLCFSNDELIDAFAINLAECVWQKPNQLYFMMGHADNENFCRCAECSAYDIVYGSSNPEVTNRGRSVLMMEFFNGVCKKVNECVRARYVSVAEEGEIITVDLDGDGTAETQSTAKAEARVAEIRLITFAYGFTIEPPVDENGNLLTDTVSLSVKKVENEDDINAGRYDIKVKEVIGYEQDGTTPIRGDVYYNIERLTNKPISVSVTEDNGVIMIAPLGGSFDYYHEMTDEKYNARGLKVVQGWAKASPRVVGYMYGNNFGTYAEWFDDFSSLPANYQLYADLGIEAGWAFSENSSGVKGSVAFQALRSYVYSKIQWNPWFDTNELIDDFMNNYYKVAAPYLKEYYEFLRYYYATKMHEGELNGDLTGKMNTSFVFGTQLNDFPAVLQMCNLLNDAVKAVENSSYDEYTKIKLTNRVKLESITMRYMLLYRFADYLADSVYVDVLNSYIDDCKMLEVYGKPDTEWEAERALMMQKRGL